MDRAWDSSGKSCGDVLAIRQREIPANQSVRGADTREGRGASRPLLTPLWMYTGRQTKLGAIVEWNLRLNFDAALSRRRAQSCLCLFTTRFPSRVLGGPPASKREKQGLRRTSWTSKARLECRRTSNTKAGAAPEGTRAITPGMSSSTLRRFHTPTTRRARGVRCQAYPQNSTEITKTTLPNLTTNTPRHIPPQARDELVPVSLRAGLAHALPRLPEDSEV